MTLNDLIAGFSVLTCNFPELKSCLDPLFLGSNSLSAPSLIVPLSILGTMIFEIRCKHHAVLTFLSLCASSLSV